MSDRAQSSDPLYLQVKRALLAGIRSGKYPPSSRLPSQMALSKSHSVSHITMQRAIQELIEDGVLEGRRGSGTYVLDGDAALASRQQTVAIILHDVLEAYQTSKPMFLGAHEAIHARGYGVMLLVLPDAQSTKHPDYGALRNCAGAIVASPADLQAVAWMQRHRMPYVLLQNDIVDQSSHCVSCDYVAGIAQAVTHLFDQGCAHVTLMTPGRTSFSAEQMATGFRVAHQVRGRVADEADVVHTPNSLADVQHQLEDWVDRGALPDALICGNDEITTTAVRALQRRGIKVPKQVAIVGVGNAAALADYDPPLTVLELNHDRIGRIAADMLLSLIDGGAPPTRRVLIQPELIARAGKRGRD